MRTIITNSWGRVERDGANLALIVDVPEDVWACIPDDRRRGLQRIGISGQPSNSADTVTLCPGLGVRVSTRPELAALISAYRAAEAEIKAAREHILATIYVGRDEIRTARAAEDEAHELMMRAIERGDGRCPPSYKGPRSADLAHQYPAAAAYLRAEGFRASAHFEKSAAGQRAIERMEAGEDWPMVMAEMESEWSEAARRCVENA